MSSEQQIMEVLQLTLGVYSKEDLRYHPRNVLNIPRKDQSMRIVVHMMLDQYLLEKFRHDTYRATTKGINFLRENQQLIKFKD